VAALVIAAGVLLAPACGDGGAPAEPARSPATTASPAPSAEGEAQAPAAPPEAGVEARVAGAIRPLPPAAAVPTTQAARPAPTALTIDRLGVAAAPVEPVGVDAAGDMEVPAADVVGWYRYGPRPGDGGSAVLAAHVAYDGVDGVFRHLGDLEPGDAVSVAFADGARRDFVVTAVERLPKADLPAATWAREGEPRLTLITCGGEFDAEAGSYRDNVVAYASPV
jgi:LPXTG-site transpeptidase (sortase) family protein